MTRVARVSLPAGRSNIRFEVVEGQLVDMEDELVDGMSAASPDGASVLSIELMDGLRRTSQMELTRLFEELEAVTEELATARRLAENARADLAILDVFGRRISEDAGSIAGTAELDLDQFDHQLEFISGKRMAILQTREAAEDSARELERQHARLLAHYEQANEGVPIVLADLEVESTGGMSEIALTWFSYDAMWTPEFTIRTDRETSSASVELNAMIHNETENDWSNIQLTLSTADAFPAESPPAVAPVVVDIAPKRPESTVNEALADHSEVDLFGSRADVLNAGPVTIYALAEAVTLPRKTSKRLLVDRFKTTCTLDALARPVVVPGVFSHGTIRNAPELLLLPGPCALFIDGAFVGQINLEEVPPGADFDVWYGEIPGIDVERTILERETVKTGLLGGGRLTRTKYRITIRNINSNPVDLIVEDRMPVSRSGEIDISLKNISPPLSTDTEYLKEERPLGILRWDLSLPAGGPDAQPFFIEWTVNVSRSSEVKTTPIPE